MKLKQWIRTILIGSLALSLVACYSHKKKATDNASIDDANAAYGAQSSGLGDNSNFGDDSSGGSSENMLSKRVYYFAFDSNVVQSQDKPAIAANADYLMAHRNVKALLEGHTDPRGSREYNIGLGERRAKAVAEILTAKGVNPAQIRIVSYGAEKLAVAGHTDGDYQQDRRVVLVYLKR